MMVFQESMSHVMVREAKRRYLILRISTGYDTSIRITDDVSLQNWILHIVVRFLNKLRNVRRWRKSTVQLGEKIWFQKIEKEGINSSRKRIIRGIFIGHQDRTRAIPYVAKRGGVRSHSWIRQTLSDAWGTMNLEDGFWRPWAHGDWVARDGTI